MNNNPIVYHEGTYVRQYGNATVRLIVPKDMHINAISKLLEPLVLEKRHLEAQPT